MASPNPWFPLIYDSLSRLQQNYNQRTLSRPENWDKTNNLCCPPVYFPWQTSNDPSVTFCCPKIITTAIEVCIWLFMCPMLSLLLSSSGIGFQMESRRVIVWVSQEWLIGVEVEVYGGLQETLLPTYCSELKTRKSFRVYLSLTLMRVKLVRVFVNGWCHPLPNPATPLSVPWSVWFVSPQVIFCHLCVRYPPPPPLSHIRPP